MLFLGKKPIPLVERAAFCRGTGVAFAPTSCGVAFAPTSVGGRGECDPRVGANVTPAFVWQAQ